MRGAVKKIATNEIDKDSLEKKYRIIRDNEAPHLLFWKFFSDDQKRLRSKRDDLRRKISSVTRNLHEYESELSNKSKEFKLLKNKLNDYAIFNPGEVGNEIVETKMEADSILSEQVTLAEEVAYIERCIQPHIQEYERLKAEASSMGDDISKAERFERDLSRAENSYEKAMIHEECKSYFGTGSPKEIIRDRSAKMRRLNNNIPKLERRIGEELQKFERIIEHLLIDGNNACYERETFIELRALSALLGDLNGKFKVTVVFDASIRSLMRTDTQGIEKLLGQNISMYIAPTRTSADEYLLKLAGESQGVFILSNDRYAEYHDYNVVKSNRLLRFMIVDRRLIANDLDVDVQF